MRGRTLVLCLIGLCSWRSGPVRADTILSIERGDRDGDVLRAYTVAKDSDGSVNVFARQVATLPGVRVRSVLPTGDGADLIVLGTPPDNDASVIYTRVGLRDSDWGQSVAPTVSLLASAAPLLPAVTASGSAPAGSIGAAWVGSGPGAHLALITGAAIDPADPLQKNLSFFNLAQPVDKSLRPAGQVPGSWSGGPALRIGNTGPSDKFTPALVAGGGKTLFVSDLGTTIVRIDAGSQTQCAQFPASVLSMIGLPDGQIVYGLDNNKVRLMSPDACASGTDSDRRPATQQRGLAAVPEPDGGYTVFGVGYVPTMETPKEDVPSSEGAQLTVLRLTPPPMAGKPWSLVVKDEIVKSKAATGAVPCCSVAALRVDANDYRVVLGGARKAGAPVVYSYNGSALTEVPVGGNEPPAGAQSVALVQVPTPLFTLSQRDLVLNQPGEEGYVELLQPGGASAKLKILAGTCQHTNLVEAVDDGMGGPVRLGTRRVLSSGQATGAYDSPAAQVGLLGALQDAGGDDCVLTVACDPDQPGPCQGRRGGAMLHVKGGSRALALVLDRSGSMSCPISTSAGCAGERERFNALVDALRVLRDTLKALPDSTQQSLRFMVVPFDEHSSSTSYTGKELVTELAQLEASDPAKRGALYQSILPAGMTNIYGALVKAAGALAALKVERPQILLLTDGQHNTIGAPGMEDQPFAMDMLPATQCAAGYGCDTPDNLVHVVPSLTDRGVKTLYAIGLSDSSYSASLNSAWQQVTASGGGLLQYAKERPAELHEFFLRVLWDHLGMNTVLDPVVELDGGGAFERDLQVDPGGALTVVVSASGPVDVRLSYTPAGGGGPKEVTCAPLGGVSGAVCAADARALGAGSPFTLRVTNSGGGKVTAVVEAAGTGGGSRAQGALLPQPYRTDHKLAFRVDLRDQGLPVRGADVTGDLTLPAEALGTVLSNAQVPPSDIARLVSQARDVPTPVAAKAALLGRAPRYTQIAGLKLSDDGQHGDGRADDGIYGIELDGKMPGAYQLLVRARYRSRQTGATLYREVLVPSHVAVSVDSPQTIDQVVLNDPATPSKGGRLVLRLKPQDRQGNLLGPGHAAELVFTQRGRRLPSHVTEPPELDGTYIAEISDIAPDGAVLLEAVGSGAVKVLRDPSEPGGGCGCRIGGDAGPVPPWVWGGCALVVGALLGRRVRRGRFRDYLHDAPDPRRS